MRTARAARHVRRRRAALRWSVLRVHGGALKPAVHCLAATGTARQKGASVRSDASPQVSRTATEANAAIRARDRHASVYSTQPRSGRMWPVSRGIEQKRRGEELLRSRAGFLSGRNAMAPQTPSIRCCAANIAATLPCAAACCAWTGGSHGCVGAFSALAVAQRQRPDAAGNRRGSARRHLGHPES